MKNTNTHRLDAVAHDLHPDFLSTRLAGSLADRWECPALPVQHHYAHIYSLMAEHKIDHSKRVLGIAADGVGYGNEREAWGGEVLLADYAAYDFELGFPATYMWLMFLLVVLEMPLVTAPVTLYRRRRPVPAASLPRPASGRPGAA